ncbi:hypothetical protein D4Z78_21285 [Okeania hirsuta]|nr:hypothetical protein D4Z78_21285 [Okeania hirsuta]
MSGFWSRVEQKNQGTILPTISSIVPISPVSCLLFPTKSKKTFHTQTLISIFLKRGRQKAKGRRIKKELEKVSFNNWN